VSGATRHAIEIPIPTDAGLSRRQGADARLHGEFGGLAPDHWPITYIFSEDVKMQPMVAVNWLQRALPNPTDQREYAQQRAIIVVTEAIAEAMEDAGLKRSEVAERLGKTKGHISQVLSGKRNMTLRTLGDLLWTCNVELEELKLAKLGEITCPVEQAWEWHDTAFVASEFLGTKAFFEHEATVKASMHEKPYDVLVAPSAACDSKDIESGVGARLALAA
jgi:transcriptional regulator with XRE-family HTH domain